MRPWTIALLLSIGCWATGLAAQDNRQSIPLVLRSRAVASDDGWVKISDQAEIWQGDQTAVIVCDMWDSHHCLNAVRRVKELAPRIDAFLQAARARGAIVIHAPSSCMEFYRDHPARLRAQQVPRAAEMPSPIETWCNWKDAAEEGAEYPIDQSDGGEDDDPIEHAAWQTQLQSMGRNPGSPWVRQIAAIQIEDRDYITDDGVENWSILQQHGIRNVMLVGVHTNMCVLGRPFGLRQLSRNGKHTVLVRDLTDTMYNPAMRPFVSHFSGTDLIIEHIEQHVCPTITSDQLLGGVPHRFSQDRRPHVVMLIGEDEYQTRVTLPSFARHQLYRDCRVSLAFADDTDLNRFHNVEAIESADVLLVSVRRRLLPKSQLQVVRNYVAAGKPVVGIRTASHAFSPRGETPVPDGHAAWPEFDAEVLGGNYQGHHGNKGEDNDASYVWPSDRDAQGVTGRWLQWQGERRTASWLYKTSPLRPGANVLLEGRVGDRLPHEPVAWTYLNAAQGRTFYTSLGHPDDFAQAEFQQLLRGGIDWALAR